METYSAINLKHMSFFLLSATGKSSSKNIIEWNIIQDWRSLRIVTTPVSHEYRI